MIRVLLADDQHLVRAGFRALLEAEDGLEVVGEAATGREAVELIRRTTPDVVLMDIRMPDGDGLWATGEVVRDPALAGTRIVIVTTFELDALLSPGATRRRISRVAGGLGPAPDLERLAVLTEREREVLALVGHGLTNTEIAERLYLSPLTAKTHVSRIITKLGARDRVHLVVLAYETGLVRPGQV